MKRIKHLAVLALTLSVAVSPLQGLAAEKKANAKAKPYPLKTCLVSGEKLGEMGDPYVFVHEGREIKFCCKNCLKDFKKDTAKYLKQLDEAEAKAKAKK